MSLRKVLETVRAFRATNADTPVVLMGYANPIEAMGQASASSPRRTRPASMACWWSITRPRSA